MSGDIRTFDVPSGRFSHVIHAATDTSVDADRDPATLIASIVDGTRRVLDLASACSTERLLYVSSGAIYGRQPLFYQDREKHERGHGDRCPADAPTDGPAVGSTQHGPVHTFSRVGYRGRITESDPADAPTMAT